MGAITKDCKRDGIKSKKFDFSEIKVQQFMIIE
jgi:hypothetical protein